MSTPPPPPPATVPPPPPAAYVPPPPPGLVITTTDKINLSKGIKSCVYGRSGIGKTRLLATAPAPIIVSAEGGLLSLRDKSIPAIEINTLDDLNRAHDYLSGPGGNAYHTIGVDSLSDIAEKVLANAKKGTKDGRQAYGVLADQMWQTIWAFRDLVGKQVVMIAKAQYVKDDATGVTRWAPMMPGKNLTQGLAYQFDEVFHLGSYRGAGGEFIALQTQADLSYEAKDRSGALDFFEYPDLTAVFNKIYGVK